MKRDRYLSLVLTVVAIHLAFFAAGFVFMGLEYSLLVSFLWAAVWLTYCAQRKRSAGDDYYGHVSVPALALIGGPFTWILHPRCLTPEKQRQASGEAYLWFVAQKVVSALRDAVAAIMGIIYSYCETDHPAKD